jgi:trk system potassium uptake protein TrkA
MRFVIVGFGRVGARTALLLREEGHDVVVVDSDYYRTEVAEKRGFEVVHGEARNPRVLADAGIEDADGIAALSGNVDADFEACMLGKEHGARTVMRVGEDYVKERYEGYEAHVDELVYPERLGAAAAKTALLGGDMEAIAELTTDLTVATVVVPAGAPIVGDRVNAIDLGPDARIYAHGNNSTPMTIPLPGTRIDAGDRLALLVENHAIEEIRERLVGQQVTQ